jgi:hypothetical protein
MSTAEDCNLLGERSNNSLVSKEILSPSCLLYQTSRIAGLEREVMLNQEDAATVLNKEDAAMARYCDAWLFVWVQRTSKSIG